MAIGTASVVKIGAKKCKPFSLDVMIYAPESGYKAEISVREAALQPTILFGSLCSTCTRSRQLARISTSLFTFLIRG